LPQAYREMMNGPRLTTGEFWEAVHRTTGMSIVADYYTRIDPVGSATAENVPLFDALCRAGDALGVRWSRDGTFLVGRSSAYFWDKLKEAPKRQLERWAAERQQNAGLPLAGLLEIAGLSDAQLDSSRVGEGVCYLYGLWEWGIVGRFGAGGPAPSMR